MSALISAAGYAAISLAKLRFATRALKDVPPDQRVAVINAIGRALERWGTR